MLKAHVRVKLVAECEVEVDVTYNEGEDPRDLSPAEKRTALSEGETCPDWEVDRVELTP